ncbi:MAG TPA: DUF4097 family beta strand repeat-containing protein [Candidatus Acidoferrales bacterium]|nr:DUF4097 family beta strand repeat-containing protein [Candidatus Acidoferrales bacterium]
MTTARRFLLAAAALLAGAGAACIGPAAGGSFDRTLTVGQGTRLELINGEGSARITAGAPGQVRVHGEFQLRAWFGVDARERAAQISSHPPVQQDGNLIRVGFQAFRSGELNANYVIEVPPDAEVRTVNGSGNVTVAGIAGPLNIITGSGDVTASQIQGELHATAGSGDIRLHAIKGSAEVRAGSGDVELDNVGGEVRVTTGSGEITLSAPGSSATIRNGSGDIRVSGVSGDLRVRTGSGGVTIAGSPSPGAYWELHSASGDVTLNVPSAAAFRFYATTRTGEIRSALPLTIEERGRHELRAVVGQGSARVEVQTSSGDIHLDSPRP